MAVAATASAATVPASRDPVISPAPELLTPAADASIGSTENSRKKLVSVPNSARNVNASGTGRSRPGTSVPGCAWVKVLIQARYEATGILVRSDFMAIKWSGLSPELLVRLDRS